MHVWVINKKPLNCSPFFTAEHLAMTDHATCLPIHLPIYISIYLSFYRSIINIFIFFLLKMINLNMLKP